VLGRDFIYALLQAAGEVAAPALKSSLDQLAEADLLIAAGAGPQATYRFKHALLQDAGYDSLLRDPRHALHRRAIESLRNDQERAAAAPEIIAHHSPRPGSTISRSNGGARRGRPGAPKLRLHEAIAHLGKAIAIADKAAGERRYLQMPMATR
jgi:hypothetical protein